MDDELRRLQDDAESKRRAFTEHLLWAVTVAYQGGKAIGSAEAPIDNSWLAQYYELRAAAEMADHAFLDHIKRRFGLG